MSKLNLDKVHYRLAVGVLFKVSHGSEPTFSAQT